MSQVEQSEGEWFAENLHPHEPMLRAWLRSRFSTLDVDDVVQEAYFRVLKARAKAEVKAPKAFLFATARNVALNVKKAAAVRGENVVAADEELEILDESESVEETIARNQELELLTRAIQTLPKKCRQIFTLRKVYGMAPKDIAAELGLSITTVYAQLSIGVSRCVDFIKEHRYL